MVLKVRKWEEEASKSGKHDQGKIAETQLYNKRDESTQRESYWTEEKS